MVNSRLITIIVLIVLVIVIGVSLTKNINLKPYAIQKYAVPKNSITINPSEITVNENEYFSVEIYFNSEKPVYTLSFDVVFDPDIVKVVSAEEGGFFKKSNIVTYPIIKLNNLGKIKFSNTILGQNEGIMGSNTLLNIKFQSLKRGVNKVDIENLQIANSKMQVVTEEYQLITPQ